MNRDLEFWANALWNYRVKHGITQQRVSEITGLSTNTISNLENRKLTRLSAKTIYALHRLINDITIG